MRTLRYLAALGSLVFGATVCRAQRDTAVAKRPFIGRILGVFDQMSGQPIEGVEVFDLLSKSSALTTSTGTVALSFVDSGGSMVRLRKLGYASITLTIGNREGDAPITAEMQRTGVVLPAVKATAARSRGAADTIRKLELNGFYDRRAHSGAAPTAFVLGERLQHLMTFDDFEYVTGRPICEKNLYIDGVRVKPNQIGGKFEGFGVRPPRNLRKNSLDQFVDPKMVLAIENYRVAEMPVEFNGTKDADAGHACGATIIWTK